MDPTAALFSQAELCDAAGIDNETANNWIKRGLIGPADVGGRRMRGRRLFSLMEIYKARLMRETVEYLMIPASPSVDIATRAITAFMKTEKLTRIGDHQEPTFTVASVVRKRGQWIVDLRSGRYALESLISDNEARLNEHAFAILPMSQPFIFIHRKCLGFLRTSS